VVSFEPAVGVVSKETRSPIPCPSAFLSSGRLKRQALKRAEKQLRAPARKIRRTPGIALLPAEP
jgi:hypothetical protein